MFLLSGNISNHKRYGNQRGGAGVGGEKNVRIKRQKIEIERKNTLTRGMIYNRQFKLTKLTT